MDQAGFNGLMSDIFSGKPGSFMPMNVKPTQDYTSVRVLSNTAAYSPAAVASALDSLKMAISSDRAADAFKGIERANRYDNAAEILRRIARDIDLAQICHLLQTVGVGFPVRIEVWSDDVGKNTSNAAILCDLAADRKNIEFIPSKNLDLSMEIFQLIVRKLGGSPQVCEHGQALKPIAAKLARKCDILQNGTAAGDSEQLDVEALKNQVAQLTDNVIKKDMLIAKLQAEFDTYMKNAEFKIDQRDEKIAKLKATMGNAKNILAEFLQK